MPAGKTENAFMRMTDPVGWLKEILSDVTRGLEEFCGRYYGVYPGRVIDNADPQGRGRVRATCPAIKLVTEDDVSSDYWMMPSMNGLGTIPETGEITGTFHPPDVGTNIWVLFQFGNPDYPVYIGGFLTTKTTADTFASEDAWKKGIRTKSGHYIVMDDDPDNLSLTIGKGDGSGAATPMFLSFTKEGHCMLTNQVGSTLYMNGEKPETSLMTANEDGEVTSMLMLGDDKITLATKSGGAYGIDGKDHTATGDNFVADCSKEFVANSGSVKLGKNAMEPAVRGMKFMQWSLIHQHTMPMPIGVTTPGPTPPPMLYNELSEKVFIA
jgi:hypothetical protein